MGVVTTKPVIEIFDLTKKYQGAKVFALQGLNISVFAGDVYGYLGPNGAGKSTTIKLLMNFLQPTAGGAKILGKSIVDDSVALKRHIGYLSGDISLYPKMTGKQFLTYMSELQPSTNSAYKKELVKRLKIDLTKKLGELSRGNRQKVAIVQAFMHKPDVLILDEPTSGLDPLMQEVFFELVAEAKNRGAAIFVSSHIMSEVQKMCNRVGIIKEGKLVGEYSVAEIAGEVTQTFDIVFNGKMPAKSEVSRVPGLKIVSYSAPTITVHMTGKLSPLFLLLAKYDVQKLDAKNLDLEETFMHFYKDKDASS